MTAHAMLLRGSRRVIHSVRARTIRQRDPIGKGVPCLKKIVVMKRTLTRSLATGTKLTADPRCTAKGTKTVHPRLRMHILTTGKGRARDQTFVTIPRIGVPSYRGRGSGYGRSHRPIGHRILDPARLRAKAYRWQERRQGQAQFRLEVLAPDNKCILCGIPIKSVLRASLRPMLNALRKESWI